MSRVPVVLVVDDEAPIREVVRRYLAAEGQQVVEAADGESAVEQFTAHAPDVVVLDVMLPGIDGIEVLRRIRTRSDAYVVLVTARTEETDRLIACPWERTITSASRSVPESSSLVSRLYCAGHI